MVDSVKRLRNKTWLILAGSLTLLLVTALAITSLLVRQQAQNTIYQTLYTSLATNDLYTHVFPSNTILHVSSDTFLSSEQLEGLLPMINLTSGNNDRLIASGENWFYVTAMESGQGIVLVDVTHTMLYQNQQLMRLMIGGGVGLILFIGISFLLANGLIKPTKMTVEMRKEMALLKKRFIANASHELRTPLTMIKGGVDEVLNHKAETVEDQLKWFGMIGTGINRIDVLTNELSILADLEDEHLTPSRTLINVSHCIEKLVKPWEALANERAITFKVKLDSDLLIHTNLERLEQLLEIFLNNAFEHVNEKGSVEIKVTAIQQQVQILITNSGTGIPVEELSKIFEHFHRVGTSNVNVSGSGLGLTIAKKIVDQLGGKVLIQNVANESTQVELMF